MSSPLLGAGPHTPSRCADHDIRMRNSSKDAQQQQPQGCIGRPISKAAAHANTSVQASHDMLLECWNKDQQQHNTTGGSSMTPMRCEKLTLPITKTACQQPFKALEDSHRYILTASIHNSLFGVVKLAFDRLLLTQVSIKISSRTCLDQSLTRHKVRVLENVRREAAVMRSLAKHSITKSHSAKRFLCNIIEECEDESYHYLVSEYCIAGDLFSALMALPNNKLSEKKARILFTQIAKAVQLMHQLGVAHTDLSLENICMNHNGEPRIIDFGVAACEQDAKVFSEAHPQDLKLLKGSSLFHQLPASHPRHQFLLAAGNVKPGKPSYMSPELYGVQSWDAFANDCWALGVILYSTLTGRPPFEYPGEHEGKLDVWFDALYSGKWLTYLSKFDARNHSDIYVYSTLSVEALDLLNRIFKSQEERLDINQILSHPWMNATD